MNHHDIPPTARAAGPETTTAHVPIDDPAPPLDQSTFAAAKPAVRWLTAAAPAVVAGLVDRLNSGRTMSQCTTHHRKDSKPDVIISLAANSR